MSSPVSPPAAPTRIRRVIAGSLVGTTIEWYDFFLYGVAASTVFGAVFFPKSDPLTATLLSFLTYALGFAARPIGGLVFGHFGDRLGRKRLLVISLLMMGVSTCAIGLLPGYAQIGGAAPVLLTGLRLIQGFALGGEWGGAVLMVSEHGSARHRGFWASWPQAGAPAGQLIANGVLAALATFQNDADFTAWGWRIPFLLSAVLVLSGLWVRMRVEESPLFQQAQRKAAERAESEPVEKLPVLQVFRLYPREILTAMGARIAENTAYYIFTIVIATYAKDQLHMPKNFALDAVMIGAAVHLVTIPMWGALSDRIGRRPLYLAGAAGVGVWSFAFIALLNTKHLALAAIAVVVGLLFHGMMYGPQAAFFAEMFGTRVRYSGVSIGYQLSSIAAGAVAPLIAVALLKRYHSGTPIAIYVAICAAVSLVAVLSYRETKDRDLATVGDRTAGAHGIKATSAAVASDRPGSGALTR
jgi:metabolite-proton symporter